MLWFLIAGRKKVAFIYGAVMSLVAAIMLLCFSLPMLFNAFKEPVIINSPDCDFRKIKRNTHVIGEVNTMAGCCCTKTTDAVTQNYYTVVNFDWDDEYSVVDQVIVVGVNGEYNSKLCDEISDKTIDYVRYTGDLSEKTYHVDGFAMPMSKDMEQYTRDYLTRAGVPSSRLVPYYITNNYSSIFVMPILAGICLIGSGILGFFAYRFIKRDKLEKEQAVEQQRENGYFGVIK